MTRRWSISTPTHARPRNLFAEDFDHRELEEAAPPPAAPDVMPEMVPLDEHNSKCVRAWAEGQQAGVAAARADQRAKAVTLLMGLNDAIAAMRDEWLDEARAIAEALAGVLCTSLTAAFPRLCASHGAAEVRAIVADLLPELTQDPDVALRIAPAQATTIMEMLEGTDRRDIRIRVIPDAAMTESDFRLEWARGEARRDAVEIWRRIEAILAPQGLIPPMPMSAEPERESVNVD